MQPAFPVKIANVAANLPEMISARCSSNYTQRPTNRRGRVSLALKQTAREICASAAKRAAKGVRQQVTAPKTGVTGRDSLPEEP